ncbi:sensor domain-containing protein [Mycolicibacterium litorale]|uniref:Sensor domain-containing protein n=1 Tax=Mycolicibacterium litorale TaxID=758802 RepID=A0AAD1INP2_9MYCO|nr:sensor domain-containing protein [Mycolicibacterium litorale]MCV7415628.1 sensor domain-containing protein [Mycolicibacterium litorale]TDY08882.1 PknH-like protein [Mycolicibacterium litorale]BBY16807.1 sensor domain-containing protein [Mycolicibacterium litorale]
MTAQARALLAAVAAMLTAGCVSAVGGTAVRPVPGLDDDSRSPVDVDTVLLETAQMQAITGAGEALTIIPSMDGKIPVDIEPLMEQMPEQCAWLFAESQTFGDEVEEFHKTTFQNPPDGGLISQGAAGYRDAPTARRAFDGLVALVDGCATTDYGPAYIGEWAMTPDGVHTRPGDCGRDYRLKSAVLVEVTFCAFTESVPDIVMTNILAKVPG